MARMRGRKVAVFVILNIIYTGIFILILIFKSDDVLLSSIKFIILGLFANGITFIGGNTLDKWIKSKWFNEDLFKNGE